MDRQRQKRAFMHEYPLRARSVRNNTACDAFSWTLRRHIFIKKNFLKDVELLSIFCLVEAYQYIIESHVYLYFSLIVRTK